MQPAVILRAPAVRAALIQLLALACTLSAAIVLRTVFSFQINYLGAAIGQGAIAAALSWRRLARWWVAIQLLFPAALLLTLALRLPPGLFLAAFLFFLLLYWSTFRTQVPFYPSGPALWREVEALLPAGPARIVDIGSGLGGLALHLARARPDCDVTGIELAPLPWLVSRLRAPGGPANLRFTLGDYDGLDFAAFDVVFAYLSPAAMERLWRKAAAEMRPETLLLSYEFAIPGQEPALRIVLDSNGKTLHGWRF
jgi:SAM-dependent methyltransferase